MSAILGAGWLAAATDAAAEHAERELEAMVAISSPSGDVRGAEEMCSLIAALLPAEAAIERPECSTAGHASDLLATLAGTGTGRVLLLGHLDTVIAHEAHRPLERAGDRLIGSGTVDMKGGIALAVAVMRAFAALPATYAELCLLAVNDEEWRVGDFAHGPRFAGFDACLCFEGGETTDGADAIVARRKAAGTLRVRARGVAAHSGSAPDAGRNALLALGEAARLVAARSDGHGPEHLTAVPTVVRAGDAFNVVPAEGELICDLRADTLVAFEPVLEALPPTVGGVELEAELVRRWPGMDTRALVAERIVAPAAALLGRPLAVSERGGASDASHLAAHVELTLDGLGPLGGKAHHPDEFVLADSLRTRAEVALAVTAAALNLEREG